MGAIAAFAVAERHAFVATANADRVVHVHAWDAPAASWRLITECRTERRATRLHFDCDDAALFACDRSGSVFLAHVPTDASQPATKVRGECWGMCGVGSNDEVSCV